MAPTWDLFILVFFAIIVAYSFIIGRSATVKIIIATYIAILATDGLGNLIERALLAENPIINIFSAANPNSVIVLKILIFVLSIVVLMVRGSFFVGVGREGGMLLSLMITTGFGVLSAGLIVATILTYISGGSFIGSELAMGGIDITRDSTLARALTDNYNLWFSLPAVAFVVASFVEEGGAGEAVE